MLSAEILEKIKNEYRFFIEITFVYSLLLATGYAIGFWSTFNVNIFPFLNLSDLIKSTAYPLLLIMPYMVIQWFIIELNRKAAFPLLKKMRPEYKNLIPPILMLISILIGAFLKILTLTLIFGIPTLILIIVLLKDRAEASMIKTIRVLLMLGIFICFSYDLGKYNSKMIFDNKEYSYSFFDIGKNKEQFKYIGYINNHYFFINLNNTHLLIKDNLTQLILERYLKKYTQDNSAIGFT